MPDDDPRRDDLEGRLLDLCGAVLGWSPAPEPARAAAVPDDDRQAWIRALRADGMSMRAVARELHLAPSTVSRRPRRAAPKS